MARTIEEREQWFKEFSKTLGYGTNPKNPADVLVDHIYISKDDDPVPTKAFGKNPFTYTSSPKQRQDAIEALMDAYEQGQLLAPDENGQIRRIGRENGEDFATIPEKEPQLEGSKLSRSIKRAINGVIPFAFKKDVEKEKQYEKDLARYNKLKELGEKNKVSVLTMSQAKKQQEEEEKSELKEKELDKNLQQLDKDLQNMMVLENNPVLKKKDDPIEILDPNGELNPDELESEELDLNDLSKEELESLQEYTLAYIGAKSSPEEMKDFLQHPGKRTVGMQKMVEDAKLEFAKKRAEFKADPENEGKEFKMEDPELTAEAVKNISGVMQKENKLSPMHRTAAKFAEKLVPAYKQQSDKLPENDKPQKYDLKFLESMNKMAEIYAEGMAAKKTLLGMDSLKQNSQERLDALSKVGAMESVNAIMQDNVKSMTMGTVSPKNGLTKEQQFFTSDVFTKDFMQQKAAKSKTIQSLAKDKPEDFHKKFLTLEDQNKLEKFGRTVNSEGSASLLKSMMNKQEQREKALDKQIAFNTPGINNPVKDQIKKPVKNALGL